MDSSSDSDEFEGFVGEVDDCADLYYAPDDSDIDVSSISDSDEWEDAGDEEMEEEEHGGNATWRHPRPFQVGSFDHQSGPKLNFGREKREIDFFLKFFPRILFWGIVRETNRHAAESGSTFFTTLEELSAFFGIHVFFSIIPVPQFSMAWTQSWLFSLPGLVKVMTRRKFEQFSSFFHLSDSNKQIPRDQPGHDRLFQVRPVIREVRRCCLHNYDPPCEQSIDEGMIPFKGRLSFKQYLPLKPTKTGLKVWMRADPHSGYVHEFQIYTGKTSTSQKGLSHRVVMDLTRMIQGRGHHIYIDSYFTSPLLLQSLLDYGTFGCGTVRSNRKGMPEEFRNKKIVTQQGESRVLQKGPLVAVAWHDKKTITFLATNQDGTSHSALARRQKDGSVKNIDCPVICQNYNKFMNGVDRADQLRMAYPTVRKTRKWWRYIFWFLFDVAVSNAFICMKKSEAHQMTTKSGKKKERTQLDFRMKLAEQLIGQYRCTRKRGFVPNHDHGGNSHWPVWGEKRKRCVGCYARGVRHEVHMICDYCQVHLCVDKGCFKSWHVRRFQATEE